MSDKAAIAATFSDFKLIRGRKVAQLVLEIPIEKAQDALQTLGMPIPGQELWCAVARLKDEPKAKPSRKFETLKLSEQAGIRCNDTAFQKWIGVTNTDAAANYVRSRCGVTTRAELDRDFGAGVKWSEINGEFLDSLGTQRAQQQAEGHGAIGR